MKGAVPEQAGLALGKLALHEAQRGDHLREVRVRAPPRGTAGGECLQRVADLTQGRQLRVGGELHRDRGDHVLGVTQEVDTVSAPHIDKPLHPEHGQRLAQRGPADAEPLGEHALSR